MRRLFKAAFVDSSHRLLMIFTVVSICLLTVSSQLEVLFLGIITKKGPDFFELFAPIKDGALQKVDQITKEDVEGRWNEIAKENSDVITKEDVRLFATEVASPDRIQQVIHFVDRIIPISTHLFNLAILLVFVAIFKAVTLFAYRFANKLLAIRISCDLRQKYFDHLQSLPMKFYQDHNIGSLSSRVVGDASLIAEAISSALVNYMQTPFTVISTLILCFLTSWKLSLIVFLGFPTIILPIVYISNKVRSIAKQIQKNQEHFSTVLIDFISGIQTVKMFNMEAFSLEKYRQENQKMADLEQRSSRYDLASRPIVHTIGMSFLSICLLWGLYVLSLSISELFFFCGLLYIFYEPVKKFAEENSRIQRGVAAAGRLFEVLDIESTIKDEKEAPSLKEFEDSIEFDRVSFRYGEEWILKDLSFRIKKGETVALVGPTGAGKSTIVQLIPRLYDVDQGEIRIDGKNIKEYNQKSLREQIAFVPQKPFLFIDTIGANIAFGRSFSKEEIEKAAKRAHADEFIERLPEKYQTELSETGKNFSGGQQQRLAIARALIKQAPILIMDEATSSLDALSEKFIKQSLKELKKEMTQIIIAHRLSTIEDADKIIYIESGRKTAEGTKEELLQSCPGFQKMWWTLHEINEERS